MAVKALVVTPSADGTGLLATWTALTQTGLDTGDPIDMGKYDRKSIQASGTLGVGGSMLLEWSNDKTNWTTAKDGLGIAIALAASPSGTAILETARWFRPRVTAGDGTTSFTANLWGQRPE